MSFIIKIIHTKYLYIFILLLALIIFFFSTVKSYGKAFEVKNIDISKPFKIDFNKNDVIDDGFKVAFFELIELITNSVDQKKINDVKLNEIKGMIESFTIKEEKFINEIYNVTLGVSFNKKKIFDFLEKKNIFPSIPIESNFLFFPIIIDEKKKDLLIFYDNKIYDEWDNFSNKTDLIKYILPTEDLEDLDLLKNKYDIIEKYDFKEINDKYSLKNSIIALIFINQGETRVLSRITIKDEITIKNKTFIDIDINNNLEIKQIITDLKTSYEDHWKDSNQINTSIKLNLNIKLKNENNLKITKFEKTLLENDLVYDFSILKLDSEYTFYKIIFNGTPDIFIKTMSQNEYYFNTQNKIWTLK